MDDFLLLFSVMLCELVDFVFLVVFGQYVVFLHEFFILFLVRNNFISKLITFNFNLLIIFLIWSCRATIKCTFVIKLTNLAQSPNQNLFFRMKFFAYLCSFIGLQAFEPVLELLTFLISVIIFIIRKGFAHFLADLLQIISLSVFLF